MRWTLRTQILVPYAILLLVVIALTSAIAATLAVRKLKSERVSHSQDVANVLSMSNFPVTQDVLEKLKILTGCELVVTNSQGVVTTTHPEAAFSLRELQESATVELAGADYQVIPSHPRTPVGQRLFILAPRTANQIPWSEVISPLFGLAMFTGVIATGVAAWLAGNYARQIRAVQRQLKDLAEHRYEESVVDGSVLEFYELQHSTNELAKRLAGLESQISRTERLRLLAQLSGGLAHTLRNALAGARLAIQYHQKRCHARPSHSGQGSEQSGLEAAQLQLRLIEDQVQGLLVLGSEEERESIPGDLREILQDVERLITPVSSHHRVECTIARIDEKGTIPVTDSNRMRIAILNLCLNGIEACGPGGAIRIDVGTATKAINEKAPACEMMELTVADNGPGIPSSISGRLGEPFVTGKPEGVGLGLMIARNVAQQQGGQLSWHRTEGWTIMTLSWPLHRPTNDWPACQQLQEAQS